MFRSTTGIIFTPARQCPRCVRFLRRSELAPKELIPMCQRDNFAPAGFEIQIGVLNSGRKVDFSKTRGNEFTLRTAHFLFQADKVKTRLNYCYSKNTPSQPLGNSLFHLESNSLLCCLHLFNYWGPFPRNPDYPGEWGNFSTILSLKFKFKF